MTSVRIARCLKTLLMTLTLTLALASVGCSSGMDTSPEDVGERVAYLCDRGAPVAVVFYPSGGKAELLRNDEVIALESALVGSGFKYTNMKTTIRGKGDEMLLEIGRMAPITCKAQKTVQ